MALTPEDVVNKKFQSTRFSEGYDQDEVDDFLDEVVDELRRLIKENDELKRSLSEAQSQLSQVSVQTVQAPAAPAAPAIEPAAARNEVDEPQETTNLLQLAQRLHDEHVREGIDKRDSLVAEGHATASRLVSEAEEKQRTITARLNEERITLERKITDLRNFERDYRSKLRGYIESQLRDLEQTSLSSNAPATN